MHNMGWVFTGTKAPLICVKVEEPNAGDGEVVLDVACAGLCHSDIGIIEGTGKWITHTPIVLGHEVAGVIREIGPNVEGFAIGDRVVIGLFNHGERRKTSMDNPGLSRNGGFQQRAIAKANELVRVPANVSMAQAAAATDSVMTAYHAVKCVAKVGKGTVVGIIGMGGLGLNAVQIALCVGATVHGADINERARKRASEFGAATTHADAAELAQFSPEVVLDFAGFGVTIAAAIKVVRPHGTVVLVGLGALEATISTERLALYNIRLLGSSGGSAADLETVLKMLSEGVITNVIEELPFEQLPDGIQRLTDGDLVGRLVLRVAES